MAEPGTAVAPRATYLLPLRWSEDNALEDLALYLDQLTGWIEVMVLDGSAPELFAAHNRRFPPAVRHIPVVPVSGENGKVSALMTGIRLADTEALVLADDDVRYDKASLGEVLRLLEGADIVRPQNYFSSLPWHGRWDTARTLINRAFGADYPGTFALRRSFLLAVDGYDRRVLFENLELLRTVKAAGGTEVRANAVFVPRVPPTARHFLRQRVRQAYDDFAQPVRLVTELSFLPFMIWAAGQAPRKRPGLFMGTAAAAVCAAEIGRRKNKGRQVFGASAALWAPLWVLERSVSVWCAVVLRLTGGVPYAGTRLRTAAHSVRRLRRRHGERLAHALPPINPSE